MSPRRRVAIIVGVMAAALLPFAALALTGDRLRSVELSPTDAATRVADFIRSSTVTAESLSVSGPNDGAFSRGYAVTGPRIAANVDAHTGAIITLYIGSATGVGSPIIDAKAARMTAAQFLADRSISVAGLEESVRFADHGESSEYVIEWGRSVNGAIVPDFRTVGIDASTGLVFRYASLQRPFDPPPTPKVDQSTAISDAIKLVGLTSSAQLDDCELRVVFTQAGVQRLVWHIYLSDSVGTTDAGLPVPGHWMVEVDAMSGAASVATTG